MTVHNLSKTLKTVENYKFYWKQREQSSPTSLFVTSVSFGTACWLEEQFFRMSLVW